MAAPTPPDGGTPPQSPERARRRRYTIRMLAGVAAVAALVTLGVAALLTNIFERRAEARDPFFRVVAISDTTTDPAQWGQNFPVHYDLYRRTVDMTRTRYGGSEGMPQQPTVRDPRDTVSASRLEEDPRLREFWAGYAFAEDFREERGHAYMLDDQIFTRRQDVVQQPGACLHCHASVYTTYLRLGNGDIQAGFDAVNRMKYQEAVSNVNHPVSCIDCHDPGNMQLRITRPAFMTGIRALKASQGVDDYDVNQDATRQEMRTYVCAQCHVEYHFAGPEKTLTFPWAKGIRVDSIVAYYDQVSFRDWTHATSGAPALKAQHPEFEMFSQGIHARSGVACADCHMPYQRVGAAKVSDHWVRSPLLNLDAACKTCHGWSEDELRQRVHTIQERTYEMRNIAIDAVLDLTNAIAAAVRADSANPGIAAARQYQRHAQFFADFVEAENSMGFHADQEAVRILGKAVNYARLGQAALAGRTATPPGGLTPPPAQTVTPAPRAQSGSND